MNEQTVKSWILKAESDLKTAKDELATPQPATDTVCFHAQQCVEKYLKAFLVFHGREVRKTHNISDLINECLLLETAFENLFEIGAQDLTDYAVQFRYPGDLLFPTLEETREAVEIAEQVKQFVLQKLREHGFQPE